MKNKLLVSGLALAVVINISALVTFAYHRWLRPQGKSVGFRAADSSASFGSQLCLSGEQEKCIRDIRSAFDSATEHIQAQIQEKRRTLVEEMKKETPDMASLDKLIEEISRLQAEIQKKAVQNLLKEKNTLTPDQKDTFFRMFEEHVCPRGKKAPHGPPGGGDKRCPEENAMILGTAGHQD